LGFGYVYARSAHGAVGWPLAAVLGVCFGLLVLLIIRRQTVTAPFRLVVRLANDDTGDSEDDKLFDKLRARFKSDIPSGMDLKFDGFDIGGGYLWFYFNGADGKVVRDAVLSLVKDCTFRDGSYFEIDEKDRLPVSAV